jgi:hypothetical protein
MLNRRFNEQAQQASGPSIDLQCGFVPVTLSRPIIECGCDLIAAGLGQPLQAHPLRQILA